MKNLIVLAFFLFSGLAHTAPKTTSKINTDEGYPYKNLINKSERVELRYTENGHNVSCRVVVQSKEIKYAGELQTASAKRFKKSPMSTCLTRDKAKEILALL